MKKLTKLISYAGISLGSLFFNPVYSQRIKEGIYKINGLTYQYKQETGCIVSYWGYINGHLTFYNDYKDCLTSKTPNTNSYNYNKTSPSSKTKKKSDLNDILNTTNATLNAMNAGLSLIDLFIGKKQKNINYSAPPVNNPPTNYNLNPKDNVYWWKEDKNNKNWWNDEQIKEKSKDGNWWDETDDKFHKTAEDVRDKIAEILPGGEIMIKADKEFIDFMKDKNGKNYWEEGYSGSSPEEIKNYIDKKLAGELKKAEEFYKKNQENTRQPKWDDTLRIGSYKFNKIGTKNYDYSKSKIEKIIIYEAYKATKEFNPGGAGTTIEAVEMSEEIKEKGLENWIAEKTKEAKEVDFLFFNTKDIYYKNSGKEKSLWDKMNETPNFIKYIALENSPGGGIFLRVAKVVEKSASNWWDK